MALLTSCNQNLLDQFQFTASQADRAGLGYSQLASIQQQAVEQRAQAMYDDLKRSVFSSVSAEHSFIPKPENKVAPKNIRQELQNEIDDWLKDTV